MQSSASEDVSSTLDTVTSALPGGGESRPGQIQMANAVARAMGERRHLIVQAGTGTGKSLAYLVPALLANDKVVVATATKALQDQLYEIDAPAVVEALDRPVRVAILKGRANYLCKHRLADLADRGFQPAMDSIDVDEQGNVRPELSNERLIDQVKAIMAWAASTETGDRAELSFEPAPRAWSMVSVGPQECPGAHRCPQGETCFTELAKAKAAESDLIIVNTHLYGAHVAAGGTLLPEHDTVIFDEAHEVEEIMTHALGFEVSSGRFRRLASLARDLVSRDDSSTIDSVITIGDLVSRVVTERAGERVLTDAGEKGQDAALRSVLVQAERSVRALLEAVRSDAPDTGLDGEGMRRAAVVGAATHLVNDLQQLLAPAADQVAWIDDDRRSPVLHLSPIDVAGPLRTALFDEVTAVLTSATIPAQLGDRLGIDSSRLDTLDAGSPFDYRANSLLYVAKHLPDRRDPKTEPLLYEELARLIRAAGGRTLALFTSRRATEAAATHVRALIDTEVLVQGETTKTVLLRRFREEESTSLFATLGFWQGVDVPGRSCTLVAIDRLPFSRPDDPLLLARRERAGVDAFRVIDLPRTATLLAQGVGRLIRSKEDRGVVAVFDSRLATANYRGALLEGLPPMKRTTSTDEVCAFLETIANDQ